MKQQRALAASTSKHAVVTEATAVLEQPRAVFNLVQGALTEAEKAVAVAKAAADAQLALINKLEVELHTLQYHNVKLGACSRG